MISYAYGETPIELIQECVNALGGKYPADLNAHDVVTILTALREGSFDAAGLRVQMLSALGIEEC